MVALIALATDPTAQRNLKEQETLNDCILIRETERCYLLLTWFNRI